MSERPTIASLHADVGRLESKLDEQIAVTKELVDAWKTANGVVRFVKWASTLVTAIGVIWAAIRYGVWPSS